MGAKGPVNTKIDTNALNEVIVFANQYRQEVTDRVDTIRKLCRQMEDNETLKGGDGEVIRENFMVIAQGCNNLDSSMEKIVKVLNDRLGKAIEMYHGKAVGSTTDDASKASRKVGVMKE